MFEGSTDYVVSLTRWAHLWQLGGIEENDVPKFLFSRSEPIKVNGVTWKLVQDIRREIGDGVYDKKIRKYFTLIVDDPTVVYKDINVIWVKFIEIFKVFYGLVSYTEVWKDYYRQVLHEMYEDGVQYLEFRAELKGVGIHF